jgi:2-polyprenyl-3-methyl-5-hydroxy-6-metoxy-1,4-benzoquinol methylase
MLYAVGVGRGYSSGARRARQRAARDWDRIGQEQPYFGVLTDRRYLREAMTEADREALFASGAREVELLLGLVRSRLGSGFAPRAALDFGCGVGRLAIALARRIERVVGVDVSPSMLQIAEQHRDQAGLDNLELARAAPGLPDLAPRSFDLVVSMIVFQHIPVTAGEAELRALLELLAPGGACALHLTVQRSGGPLRRLARWLRARLPVVHATACWLRGEDQRLPYLQMNTYDVDRIVDIVRRSGCGDDRPDLIWTNHGGVKGVIVVAHRPERAARGSGP